MVRNAGSQGRLGDSPSGKASGKFCPCGVYNKGYPVKCRSCGQRFA
ncbi:hypothetical protein LCGC14_2036050 [marine sediment metagenome]|uniref:Uncharacterized protein n=1 Tax=marine sediment metagenome TaxID=412755 RepID=A0A0F9H6S4_9ZZZZ